MAAYQLGAEITPTEIQLLAAFLRSLTGDQPEL